MVRDYRQWTEAGRQVRRGEKGIEIFAIPPRPAPRRPQDRDHVTTTSRRRPGATPTGSPTSGTCRRPPGRRSPPARPARRPAAPAGLWDALCWLARREGFAVEHEHGAAGRRHHLLGRPPHPAPARPERRAGRLGAGAPARPRPAARRTPAVTRPGRPPPAAPGCARPKPTPSPTSPAPATASPPRRARLPGKLGRPRPARPARGRHPRRRAPHHHRRRPHHPAHRPHPARRRPAPVPAPRQRLPPRPPGVPSQPAAPSAARPQPGHPSRRAPAAGEPSPRTRPSSRDAQTFYTGQLAGSWAPGYLAARGISKPPPRDWHIGYAPAGWTALTSHLRSLGHDDDEIQAAGLAKPSSRGTLIDFPGPDHAPRPRRRRHARRVHRPRPPAAPAPTRRNTSTAPRRPPTRKAACCSACTRPARPSPGEPSPSSWKAPSTPSPSPSPTPAATPGSPPAAPP